jgi:hypothetical protein
MLPENHSEGTLQEQNPSPHFGMGFLCYDTDYNSSELETSLLTEHAEYGD